MACALTDSPDTDSPAGGVESIEAKAASWADEFGLAQAGVTAAGEDPFDDFEDDDFDDEFDDDFEEDWEDDLTEDDEFPDTFGGEDEGEEKEAEGGDDSPFSDDPDFDED